MIKVDENDIESLKLVLHTVQNRLANFSLNGCLSSEKLSNVEEHELDSIFEMLDNAVGGWEPAIDGIISDEKEKYVKSRALR